MTNGYRLPGRLVHPPGLTLGMKHCTICGEEASALVAMRPAAVWVCHVHVTEWLQRGAKPRRWLGPSPPKRPHKSRNPSPWIQDDYIPLVSLARRLGISRYKLQRAIMDNRVAGFYRKPTLFGKRGRWFVLTPEGAEQAAALDWE